MYRICKEGIEIAAGHFLYGLPEGHPCLRQHGHNYVIDVEIEGTALDSKGMLLDFGIVSEVARRFDHQNLNDLAIFGPEHPPTAENLAEAIRHQLQGECTALTYQEKRREVIVRRVRVWETKTSWGEVTV